MNSLIKKMIALIMIFGSINVVFASTKIYERTKDNLLVPDSVTVNDENINYILNTKAVDESEKIYDYADLFTDKEEAKIFSAVKKYIEDTSTDLIILTEKDIDNKDLTSYAFNFYDYNKFKKNGLIFFIYEEDKKINIYMWTSGDSYKIYTEKTIQDILEYIHPFFNEKKYYKGTSDFVKIVHNFYSANEKGRVVKINSKGEVVNDIPWLDLIIIFVSLTFIISVLLLRKKELKASSHKMVK